MEGNSNKTTLDASLAIFENLTVYKGSQGSPQARSAGCVKGMRVSHDDSQNVKMWTDIQVVHQICWWSDLCSISSWKPLAPLQAALDRMGTSNNGAKALNDWSSCHQTVNGIIEQSSLGDIQQAVRHLLDLGDTVSLLYLSFLFAASSVLKHTKSIREALSFSIACHTLGSAQLGHLLDSVSDMLCWTTYQPVHWSLLTFQWIKKLSISHDRQIRIATV